MKKLAFAVAIATTMLTATQADAMALGSLARQRPVTQNTEIASIAYPAVCNTLSCGASDRTAADYSPVLHVVFSAIGGFLRSHADIAIANGRTASVQLISLASAY